MLHSPGAGRQVRAPRNRPSTRGCKVSMAHGATPASHSTAPGQPRAGQDTHPTRAACELCLEVCRAQGTGTGDAGLITGTAEVGPRHTRALWKRR